MALELKKIGNQTAALWKRLTFPQRLLIVALGLGLVALTVFLAVRPATENFATLYSGLEPEDAGHVVEQLRAQNVPYRLENGGAMIRVPEAQVHEVRINLASAGIPRGGVVGFEVFDKQSFGSSSFVEKMNYQRALSGELARTIASLNSIERARVHLVLKEHSLYKKEDEPPSASVVLTLKAGQELLPTQVKGIVHLVASSVEGLTPDRVTVVDESGAVLWSGEEPPAGDTQHELERTLKNRITHLTDSIVGRGHSVVVVTAEIDDARTERTEELYDKDKFALRSESSTQERTAAGLENGLNSAARGIAGARANLPGASASAVETPLEGGEKLGEKNLQSGQTKMASTRNFEVNRIVNRIVGPKQRIARLHVAIMIDASRVHTSSKSSTLVQIAALAREAAGLDGTRGDRIEVQSIAFMAEARDKGQVEAPLSLWWLPNIPQKIMLLAAAGLLALTMFLILALYIRARRRARPAQSLEVSALPLPLRVSAMATALEEGEARHVGHEPIALTVISPRERAIEAARADTVRAARILAAWLAETAPQLGAMEKDKAT